MKWALAYRTYCPDCGTKTLWRECNYGHNDGALYVCDSCERGYRLDFAETNVSPQELLEVHVHADNENRRKMDG